MKKEHEGIFAELLVEGLVQVEHGRVAQCYRSNEQSEEHNKHDEVENGISDHTTSSELGLFQRIDGRADLTAVNCKRGKFNGTD